MTPKPDYGQGDLEDLELLGVPEEHREAARELLRRLSRPLAVGRKGSLRLVTEETEELELFRYDLAKQIARFRRKVR